MQPRRGHAGRLALGYLCLHRSIPNGAVPAKNTLETLGFYLTSSDFPLILLSVAIVRALA
ncbi:hypothetical protein [Providencia sp. Marseille-Q8014]